MGPEIFYHGADESVASKSCGEEKNGSFQLILLSRAERALYPQPTLSKVRIKTSREKSQYQKKH